MSGVKGSLDVIGLDGRVTSDTLGRDLSELGEKLLDLLSLTSVELGLELGQRLLSLGDEVLSLVGLLDDHSSLLVALGVSLSIGNHVLNLLVGKTRRRGDGHRLLSAGSLVVGGDVDNTVGVDVKGDLDLRDTLGRRGEVGELEVTEKLVVSGQLSLSLVNLDLDRGLAVGSGGEGLGLLGGNGGVSVDQSSEDTTESLDTEGERGNIKQQDVGNVSGKDTGLDRSSDGDSLVGVDTLAGLFAKERLDGLGNLGHSGHTTDKDDIVDLRSLDSGIGERFLARLDCSVDEGLDELLESGSGQVLVDVNRSLGSSRNVRQRDVGGSGAGKLTLGLLGSLTDSLDGHSVTRDVNAGLLLELGKDVVDERNVEIFSTKVGVTVGGLDLEDSLLHLKDGDIESSSTEIVNGDDG